MEEEKSHVVVRVLDYDHQAKHPPLRLSVEQLLSTPKYSKHRDLFLQGFAAVQQKAAKDPRGFFQISGIHGMPFAPYDLLPGEVPPPGHWTTKDEKTNRWGGYCHHGDILFPTWHRPYVMLMEQMIYDEASEIVELYSDDVRDEYKEALKTLRFPYWDWASPYTLSHGIPSVLTDKTVTVNTPQKNKDQMPNPLRAFTIPEDLGAMQLVGDTSNPTQRPYVPPASASSPFTPAGYSTVRHPNSDYRSQVDSTNLNVIMFCSAVFRPTMYQTLALDDWLPFSCHFVAPEDNPDVNYGHFASIEVVHDALHDAVGGNGGHMSYPDVAAMDPIFYLHHANVDRLIAIWQSCHPEAWMTSNTDMEGSYILKKDAEVDENTPLEPFRKSQDTFWTSKEVRDVKDLGYTYPELVTNKTKEDMLKWMLNYYHPNRYLKLHWYLNLTVGKNKVGGPFQIRVFLDLPTATADTPLTVPNFAGLISVFARGAETFCAQCLGKPNTTVSGCVDMTLCMQRLGIDVNPEDPIGGSSLTPGQIKLVVVRRDSSAVPLQEAGLIHAAYYVVDESADLPSEWVRHKLGDLPLP